MEDELKCPYCAEFYCNPVLLPCSHSLCYACALHLQEKFNTSSASSHKPISTSAIANAAKSASTLIALSSPQSLSCSSSTNLSTTDLGSSVISDLDKLSVFSEADSGLGTSSSNSSSILLNQNASPTSSSSNSRPCSYMSQCSPAPDHYLNVSRQLLNKAAAASSSQAKSVHSLSTLAPSSPSLPPAPPLPFTSTLYSTFLPCPLCSRMIYMDETGVDSLVKNTCLENIVERYSESRKLSIKCQMCPPGSVLGEETSRLKHAAFMCEQCEIYYCEDCRESCHPMRGPLQKHVLVAPKLGRDLIRKKNRTKESKCGDHVSEQVSLYCLLCKSSCCGLCVNDTAHINHQMQPINQFCRSQKVNGLIFFVGLLESWSQF